MPSLPTSLIIVGLVVAWLVVLVPMVARRREQVPENDDESANFRVLQRDAKPRRRPILSRTAMAHRSRGDADEYDADPGGPFDGEPGLTAGDVDGDRGELADDAARDDARNPESVDDAGERVDDAGEVATAASVSEAEYADRAAGDNRAVGAVFTPPPYSVPVSAGRDGERNDDSGFGVAGYDAERGAADSRFERGAVGRRNSGADSVGAWVEDRGDDRPTGRSGARGSGRGDERGYSRMDGGGDEYRRTPMRQGRGGFDPVAADRTRAYRFRQRQRVALTLVALAVAGVAVGFFGSGYGYVAAAASGVLLVLYLAYLRRQVRIENEIRRRREARLARARQIRPGYRPSVAEQVYAHRTGEIPRPGEVDGYRVTSHARPTVPPSGYGYGEPVDFEDSDPAFDDLEYYRPAAYRRRAG